MSVHANELQALSQLLGGSYKEPGYEDYEVCVKLSMRDFRLFRCLANPCHSIRCQDRLGSAPPTFYSLVHTRLAHTVLGHPCATRGQPWASWPGARNLQKL
jgi:hypothetical protein